MQKTIATLGQIQKIDLEIAAIEAEEVGYGKEAARVSAELKSVEEDAASLNAVIEGIKGQARDVEARLADIGGKAEKAEKKLGGVKSDRELSAATKEKTEAGKARKLAEQELGNLNAKLSENQTELDAKGKKAEDLRAELARITGELEGKRAGWGEILKEKHQAKETLKAAVRPDIFKKYEAIRLKRGGRGIVPVKNECCQGCFIHIPPQVYIQIKKGSDELIMCPHCYRILYFENETTPSETA